MIVESIGCHTHSVNGILGLLCKEHFSSLVEFAGKTELTYTFDHYAIIDDARDLVGRQFPNKAERVKAKLWVSLPRTTLLNTSYSLDILEILNGYIASICRISLDARRDLRTGQLWWLAKNVKNL
jgi:hypothetical protein